MIASATVSRGGYTATVTGPGLNQSVTVSRPQALSVVYVGTQGPAGASSASYTHTQTSAQSVWVINHNLGFSPAVQLRSLGHVTIGGDVAHPSVNQAVATFEQPFAGYARCT